MKVVRCWKCNTDRWAGTGPCGTCGAAAPVSDQPPIPQQTIGEPGGES